MLMHSMVINHFISSGEHINPFNKQTQTYYKVTQCWIVGLDAKNLFHSYFFIGRSVEKGSFFFEGLIDISAC